MNKLNHRSLALLKQLSPHLRLTIWFESIVLVKLVYYASSTARFLSKFFSNYACFSKFCYLYSTLRSIKMGKLIEFSNGFNEAHSGPKVPKKLRPKKDKFQQHRMEICVIMEYVCTL